MRRSSKKAMAAIFSATAMAGALRASSARATTYDWNVPSGDFNTAANWNPNGIPGTADIADVNNGGTATISSLDGTVTVNSVYAGDSTGSLFGNVLQTGGTLNISSGSGFLAVGHAHSTGIYNFSGGVINSPGIVRIYGNTSTDPTGVATQMYVGSGATLNTSAEFDVGYLGGAGVGAGTLNISGGTVNASGGNLEIGEGSNAVGTVVMNSGSVTETGQLWIGDSGNSSNKVGGNGTFILNGGTVTTSNWAVIGRGGSSTGVLTINAGTFIHTPSGGNAFEVGSYGGNNGTANTSTLNLNGGTLITDYIEDESPASTANNPGSQTINFNGGVLQANDSDGGFLGGHDPVGGVAPILNVGNNGAIFNTSTYTIGVTLPLVHSGTNPVDGGLTKYGTGTLNLSGGSTYNGATTIAAGTLNILGSLTSPITVNAGATLNLLGSTTSNVTVNSGATAGSYTAGGAGGSISGSLTFTGSTIFVVNPSGSQFLTVSGVVNGSGGTVSVSPTITTPATGVAEEVLYAKGGIVGTVGTFSSNFVPTVRGTLSESADPNGGTDLFLTSSGAANLVWKGTSGTNPSYWDVQTTPNWLNTGTNATDVFYNDDNVTFDNTGTTTNIAIQGISVFPGSVTFNNTSAKSYTLTGGAIAGPASLAVLGGGLVTLNQSNSYTGSTIISSGTLAIGATGGLPQNTAVSLGSGALNGTLKLGDATGTTSVSVASLNIVGTGTGNTVIGGNANISTLTVGSSIMIGTATNPTAALTIGAGVNVYGNSGSNPSIGIGPASGMNGTVTVLPGGTLTSDSNDLWVGNAGAVGTLNIDGGTVVSNGWIAPGRAGGTGTINMTGGSLIKQTGNGNLDIGGDGAGSQGYFYQTGGTVTTSTFVVLGENNSTEIGVWNMSGASTTANVASIIIGSSGNGTVNIFGGAQMTSQGTTTVGQNGGSVGTLNITNALDSTGGLTADYSAAVNVNSGGVLNVVTGAPSTEIGNGGGTNAALNVSAGGTFNGGNAEVHIGDNGGLAVFNVSGSVVVDNYLAVGRIGGTGTLNLYGSGSITVSNGSNGLTIIGGDGQGNGSVGYFIQTGGSFTSPTNGLEFGEQNGTNLDSGTWNFSAGTADVAFGQNQMTALTIGGAGNGLVNISGTAQLSAGNVVIASNSTNSTGVLNISAGTANVRSVDVGFEASGTLNLNGGQLTSTSLTIGSLSTSTGVLNLSGGTLTTAGIVSGNSSVNPVFNINGGILQALNNTTTLISMPSNQPVTIGSLGATIDSQAFNVAVQASLSGPGSLTKIGTGNLRLSASNSYSGNTTVSAGTLTVANPSALSNGSVVLGKGATLALAATSSAVQFTNYNLNAQTTVFTPVVSASQTAVTLTTTTGSDATSIFDGTQFVTVNDATGFAASFTYNHATTGPEQSGADGIAFVLQSGNGSPSVAGGAGGVLAYSGAPGFGSSLAAGVDLFLDRLETGAGNGSNGAFTNVNPENSSPLISETTSANVTIVYNGSAQTLTETYTSLANGSSTSITTDDVDAASLLGGSPGGSAYAYVGFTAATGGANDVQTISDFKFNPNGTTIPSNNTAAIAISNLVSVADGASSTIQLAPTLNFSSGTVGAITIGSGSKLSLSIGTDAAAGVTHGVLTAPSVTFSNASSGQLDVVNNALDLTSQSIGSANALVKSGFAGGTWTGNGITSSAAASDTKYLTAIGVIVNSANGLGTGTPLYGSSGSLGELFEGISPAASDVLVKYTYYGDTNLDGVVDGSDYARIDNAFLVDKSNPTAYTGWYNGDFNYDGVINGSDYTLIDNAYNSQGASLAAELSGVSAVTTSQVAGSSSVPEPASLGLLAIGAAGLLGRRRRHH